MAEAATVGPVSKADEFPDLVLFTDAFPFGKGEKPFLIPEIEALSKQFTITLVTQVSTELQNDCESTSVLPDSVSVVVVPPFRATDYARALPGVLTSRLLMKELRQLLDDGISARRLMDSFRTLLAAEAFRNACVRKGVFRHSEDKLYYSFWFTYKLLALCLEVERRRFPLKVLGRVNGYDLYNERNKNGRQPFQRVMRDYCSCVLFGSSTALAYFVSHFGGEAFDGQFFLSRLGVRAGVQEPRLRSRKPFLLVSCSNVVPLKRVTMIAEAVARLGNPDIRWVHFGDGPDLSQARRIVDASGCNAWLPGAVPNSHILSFYRDHEPGCFIALSETEGGCPVALQEALSFGLPAIVTAAGGAQYEGVDGNGVRLPDSVGVDDVAEAIDALYRLDDDAWMRMSSRSLELWSDSFNADSCKSQLLTALNLLSSSEARNTARYDT